MSFMHTVEIIYGNKIYFTSFHETLDIVAKERIYLEGIEAPNIERVSQFQSALIAQNAPVYYAIQNDRVVGWCDISLHDNPRMKHRGSLGMGVLPTFRGQGIGSKLLDKSLEHAKKLGLEKIDLHVYTSNVKAIALYKKYGFIQEGLHKNYRKLDGQTFDSLSMGKFL